MLLDKGLLDLALAPPSAVPTKSNRMGIFEDLRGHVRIGAAAAKSDGLAGALDTRGCRSWLQNAARPAVLDGGACVKPSFGILHLLKQPNDMPHGNR